MNKDFRSAKANIAKGIYCDFFGTLVIKGQINKELAAYLNAKHMTGEHVVVFSTSCEDTTDLLPTLGLHPDIATLHDKFEYYSQKLAVVIDDHPSLLMQAEKIYHPLSPEFLTIMRDFMDKISPKADEPILPAPS